MSPFESYKSKGICPFALKFGITVSANFYFEIFFLPERFFYNHSVAFFDPTSKMFCNFLLKLYMAKHRHVFSALGPETTKNKLKKRKTNSILLGAFKKLFGRSSLEAMKNSTIHFPLKFLV